MDSSSVEPEVASQARISHAQLDAPYLKAPHLPELKTKTPAYPAELLYALDREYINKYEPKSFVKGNRHYMSYIEQRLRKIYPNKGYDGMIQEGYYDAVGYLDALASYGDAQATTLLTGISAQDVAMGRSTAAAAAAKAELGSASRLMDAALAGTPTPAVICPQAAPCQPPPDDPQPPNDPFAPDPSWNGQADDVWPLYADGYIPTVPDEVTYTVATPAEQQQMLEIEQLAIDGGIDRWALTLNEVSESSAGSSTTGGPPVAPTIAWEAAVGVAVVAVGIVGGYIYWRGTQSARRAEAASISYFGSLLRDGTRRDAFRHIYVNVLLRRYVTGVIASLVMNHRENFAGNPPRDKYMDLHNNYLGRSERYGYFRGHWLFDRWDWTKWGTNVRTYVNNNSNREFISAWNSSPPSDTQARNTEAAVADKKYIVYL